ncbi:hypothetical protein [Martelella sp. HB161492]|uniref:hypothetical protein n=1 Tax=Martelella sp. HB161492 TaxID=2720726 RepID=UPI001590C0DC|nr:hypothetical protein [Martelella sp. HB161492]
MLRGSGVKIVAFLLWASLCGTGEARAQGEVTELEIVKALNPSSLSPFKGVLPDGRFRFAVKVDPDHANDGNLPPGVIVTFAHFISADKGRIIRTEGPAQIIELLTHLSEGDVISVVTVDPASKKQKEYKLKVVSRERAELVAALGASGDVFGSSLWGVRMRMFSKGQFGALNELLKQDARVGIGELGPLAPLVREFMPGLEKQLIEARYAGLLSMYGITRLSVLGDCGEPTDTLNNATISWTEYRNGLGQFQGSTTPVKTPKGTIEVPYGFAPILEKTNDSDVSRQAANTIGAILIDLGCESDTRRMMERNMLAFWWRKSPVFVSKD